MTEIWKDGAFADDEWVMVGDEDTLPADKPAFVSLARWRGERETLAARNTPIGLVFEPDAQWDDLRDELPRFPAVAIDFPKYADGRGFSIARLLRDRDGYQGEIRAFGEYFTDQMPYMRRVGINAFVVSDDHVRKALAEGVWPEVPYYYQPVGDAEIPAGTRPWARRPQPQDNEA